MAASLSSETIDIVKSTAPALRAHGVAITTRMYERLFEDPAIKEMFDAAAHADGSQPKRLATAIVAYAENIDKLEALTGAVERMTTSHVNAGVKAEHYPVVAGALLPAIKDVLGDAATEEILSAWGEAYWVLADILIAAETEKYAV
ncbi:MAG: globin domain-containing protein [Pseudomonadota bacterium]